jgi:hypothetical protein
VHRLCQTYKHRGRVASIAEYSLKIRAKSRAGGVFSQRICYNVRGRGLVVGYVRKVSFKVEARRVADEAGCGNANAG